MNFQPPFRANFPAVQDGPELTLAAIAAVRAGTIMQKFGVERVPAYELASRVMSMYLRRADVQPVLPPEWAAACEVPGIDAWLVCEGDRFELDINLPGGRLTISVNEVVSRAQRLVDELGGFEALSDDERLYEVMRFASASALVDEKQAGRA